MDLRKEFEKWREERDRDDDSLVEKSIPPKRAWLPMIKEMHQKRNESLDAFENALELARDLEITSDLLFATIRKELGIKEGKIRLNPKTDEIEIMTSRD